MELWTVFITGLLVGGASCAAVQGGLLAGAVARRRDHADPAQRAQRASAPGRPGRDAKGSAPAPGRSGRDAKGSAPAPGGSGRDAKGSAATKRHPTPPPRAGIDEAVPVAGFLAGRLVSHAALGFLLGVLGDAVQLNFRARAIVQIAAGVLMLVMAADLLGLLPRSIVPSPPPRLTRFVRRSGRLGPALGPAVLGLLTVLIPCGVTLSVELLAIASGSPLTGMALMAAFVVGTSPLLAVLGYFLRRTSTRLRGAFAKLAAVAVIVVALLSINAGLVLTGSDYTLGRAWAAVSGGGQDPAPAAADQPALLDAGGTQRLVIDVANNAYRPSRMQARAGVPTVLTLRTNGTRGCTRGFVIPSRGYSTTLPATGDTSIDLGTVAAGRLRYTCSMGMYSGQIDFA